MGNVAIFSGVIIIFWGLFSYWVADANSGIIALGIIFIVVGNIYNGNLKTKLLSRRPPSAANEYEWSIGENGRSELWSALSGSYRREKEMDA